MNKFLKKRSNEPAPLSTYSNDAALSSLTSLQSLSPGLKKPGTSRWKKSKKPQPEPQSAPIALPTLLPSDDFRTSLIMPNLSARFSMLREQDDPKSKIGKASDDSVLQPKRRSRLNDLGWGSTGLSDIAEVSSLRNGSSIKPPFARRSREMSYASEDGYASEAEATTTSVMSRSRPGEGNVLFGGRQKIYKIAGKGGATSRGRLVYDDDVGKSAFQQYRARERDFDDSQSSRPSDESQGFDFGLQSETGDQDDSPFGTNDSAKDFSHSPSFSGFDKKRSTTSSTTRSDARSSTAATSVTSQGLSSTAPSPAHAPASMVYPPIATSSDRSTTKGRRLYDQGLDQHMSEQQNSAMSRLNTIQQQRSLSGPKTFPVLHSTKSASDLHDRAPHPVYALQSPLPPGRTSPGIPRLNTLGSTRRGKRSPTPTSGPQSPLDEEVDALSQALEPADRGKATAMGAFNKPAHAFDERQYLERQQQLQRSNSSAVIKSKAAQMAETAAQRHLDRAEQNSTSASTSPEPHSHSRVGSPAQQKEPSKAYNVFQNAASQMASTGGPPVPSKAPLPDTHKTFFGNISASEDEDEEESSKIAQSFNSLDYGYGGPGAGKWQPSTLRPVSEHPALRDQGSKSSLAEEDEEVETKTIESMASSRRLPSDVTRPSMTPPKVPDSPTIPETQQPLGGMMRHLRQRSNQSSVYYPDDGPPSDDDRPDVPELPWTMRKTDSLSNMVDMQQSVRESQYSASNPWDLDEARSFVAPEKSATSLVGDSGLGVPREPSQSRAGADRKVSGVSSSQDDWQQELCKQHNREASTATQQERDAFENELAARRQAIQENMKSMVERSERSRGTSPAAGSLRGALGILKAKSSRDSINVQSSSKSARNLSVQDRKASNASAHPPAGDSPLHLPTAQHPAFKNGGQDQEGEVRYERQMASSRPCPSMSSRDRSLSSTTTANRGRPQSRTGNIRDDLERGREKGLSLSTAGSPSLNQSPSMTSAEFEHNPFDRESGSQQQQRSLDAKAALAYQQNYAQNNPRLTNSGPSSPLLTSNPSFPSIRPSVTSQPGSYNSYATGSPPLSAHGTHPAYNPNILNNRPGQILRKKTVSKHDISEPTLISSTSNVNTVELPARASQDQASAPPIPPINPRRRGTAKKFFGRTRSGADDSEDGSGGRPGARSPIDHVSPGPGWGGSMVQMTEQEREESMDSSRSGSPFTFPASSVVRLPNADAKKSPVMNGGAGVEGAMF